MEQEHDAQVIFTRDGDTPLPKTIRRDLCWKNAIEDSASFQKALRRVIDGSLDSHDVRVAKAQGVSAAMKPYVEVDEAHFVRDPSQWETAWDAGALVGLLQPVLYRKGHLDPRPEGTINYIGVVPECRGAGYIDDLLWRATTLLYAQSVWRIFCTTDVANVPMISAFERLGYERGGVRKIPIAQ